jgi:hypothetical protein
MKTPVHIIHVSGFKPDPARIKKSKSRFKEALEFMEKIEKI